MSYVHIITVGASLASNYERDKTGKRIPEAEIEEKLSKMQETQRTQYSKELLKYLNKKQEQGKLNETSAELNALSRYLEEISLVYLIHTDTNLGRYCTTAIQQHLKENNIQVAEPIEVEGLSKAETFQKGLANLVQQIAYILINHRNVRICATGGFKPEVAIASVLGFIAQAPVYYIHESFQQEVHLPALPIDWKYEIKKHGKALDTLITAGENGIEKTQFIKNFGQETYQQLKNSWLIEEKQNKCKATQISKAIHNAILQLSKRK